MWARLRNKHSSRDPFDDPRVALTLPSEKRTPPSHYTRSIAVRIDEKLKGSDHTRNHLCSSDYTKPIGETKNLDSTPWR